MEVKVKLREDDALKMESLYYKVESRISLFKRIMSDEKSGELNEFFDKFLVEYDKIFKDYDDMKAYIEAEYKPEDLKDKAKNWRIDFSDGSIYFEV